MKCNHGELVKEGIKNLESVLYCDKCKTRIILGKRTPKKNGCFGIPKWLRSW